MSISTEEKDRYLRETAIVLAREGFQTGKTDTGKLRVLLDGAPLCEVTENGGITYRNEDITAVVDEMFRTDELNQYLSRMNLTPRWEDGIFDRLVSSEVTGEELAQSRKGCRIWQLKKDVDVAMRFIGYEDQVRKFGEPDAENYTLVFDGDLGTSDLEQIYTICRDAPPPGYQGYRMALSDVVELYDDSVSEFYYCDRVGFQPIRFEQKQDPCINMTL